MTRPHREVDVAIIGAGLAGLTTALDLRAAGLEIVVLEARERVGGRTLNADIGDGKVVEMGGQWIGPTQDHIAALASDLGVETFPSYYEGEHLARIGGDVVRHATPFPELPAQVQAAFEAGLARLQAIADTVPVEAPWDAPDAAALDAMSFDEWLRTNVDDPEARDLVRLVSDIQATPATQLSLLWTAYSLRCSHGFDMMASIAGGAQQDRFVGGSQLVSIRAAEGLGDAIELATPVRSVERSGDRVVVRSDRIAVDARRTVIAIPPVLASRISYEPALPSDKDGVLSRMLPGSTIKVNVVYDEPFWREEGLSGQWVDPTAPVAFALDNSPPDGTPGVLVGLFEAAGARRFANVSADVRRGAALDSLQAAFGPRAASPIQYHEMDWSAETWTRGCYAGKPGIGVAAAYGRALRRPEGPIHWAGTETAMMWHGYFDGAVESGHRAAREVLDALS